MMPSFRFCSALATSALVVAVGVISILRAAEPDATALYKKHCALCHGAAGKSPLPNASFTDGVWKHGSTVKEVTAAIKAGVPGTVMKGFAGKISDAEIAALTTHVRKFDPKLK